MTQTRKRYAITRDFVRDLIPTGEPQEYADDILTGFSVRVTARGKRSYCMRYKAPDGTFPRKTIGSYPAMSPSDAREAARKLLDTSPQKNDTPATIIEKKQRAADTIRRAHGVPTLRAFLDTDYTAYLEANSISTANAALVKSSFPEFLDRALDEFTPWLLEGWKARAAKTGIKLKTIANKLHALQGLLRVATDAELIADNPARKVKRNGKADVVVRYLSTDERERLYAAMEAREEANRDARQRTIAHRRMRRLKPPPSLRHVRYTDYLQPLVVTALNSGMRKGELLALQWDDIDLEMRTIHVRRDVAKSDKRRDIPVSDELLACLKVWKALAHRVFVFANMETGEPLTDFGNAWDALLEAAQIERYRFHDCRHTFASQLVAAGVDLYRVKTLLGHSSYAMVERYAHLAPDHLHAAVAAAFNGPAKKRASRKAAV
ncbi:tyrosine-type recombinase/integrase [Paraburkholderia sp. BR10882]|uniref:tyrosine-type recombinase/integrase n=1 Tax=unclassified Paraburkholderia TaxID=2615204 RepID=UPI0034CE7CED